MRRLTLNPRVYVAICHILWPQRGYKGTALDPKYILDYPKPYSLNPMYNYTDYTDFLQKLVGSVGEAEGSGFEFQEICLQARLKQTLACESPHEPQPKPLASSLRIPTVVPYIIPCITHFQEFRLQHTWTLACEFQVCPLGVLFGLASKLN